MTPLGASVYSNVAAGAGTTDIVTAAGNTAGIAIRLASLFGAGGYAALLVDGSPVFSAAANSTVVKGTILIPPGLKLSWYSPGSGSRCDVRYDLLSAL